MLCARCGAPNADTSPFCGTCGALVGARSSAPAMRNLPGSSLERDSWDALQTHIEPEAVQPVSAKNPSFAPVARIPFNEEPLPQPSQPLPVLIQPAGEVLAFTPTSVLPTPPAPPAPAITNNSPFADYPTDVRVPVPITPPSPTNNLPNPGSQGPAQPPEFTYGTGMPQHKPDLNVLSWVGNSSTIPANLVGPEIYWAQNESSSPASQPLVSPQSQGNTYLGPAASVFKNGWEQDDGYAPFPQASQTPPFVQAQDNTYARVVSGGLNEGGWEQSAPFQQASITGPSLGNVYPGLPRKSLDLAVLPLATDDMPLNEVNRFVQPLPIWASVLSILVGAGLLFGLVFFNPDWATGALIAGVIAIILAVLLLIANGVRVALGMLAETNPRRRSQIISAVLLVLLLLAFSGVGLSQQRGLHAMQARYLEGQRNWQQAVNEFQAAGETSPASVNLARVYDEWGEALSKQQQYGPAATKFGTVLKTYPQASAQDQLARTDMVATYLAWGSYGMQHRDYATAASAYDTLLALSYCTASCQSQAQASDATAYYDLAEQQLAQQQFTESVDAFATLTTRFTSAQETGKSHADYARALWGLGQQQLNTTCSNAVKTYQQLAKQFADTSQGEQAATALLKPVAVKGHFTTPIPGAPAHPTVALVQNMYNDISNGQFVELLMTAPIAQVQSDGTFSFPAVAQGAYTLVWSYDGKLNYYYARSGSGDQSQLLYKINLGALCTYDYGGINQTITPPTAN